MYVLFFPITWNLRFTTIVYYEADGTLFPMYITPPSLFQPEHPPAPPSPILPAVNGSYWLHAPLTEISSEAENRIVCKSQTIPS